MFRCPFCGKITLTFSGLIVHVKTHLKDGRCPICLKEVRDLKRHTYAKAKQGGKAHRILYGLLNRGSNGYIGDLMRECRYEAYRACEVK